jgi:hypothetical protein
MNFCVGRFPYRLGLYGYFSVHFFDCSVDSFFGLAIGFFLVPFGSFVRRCGSFFFYSG